MTILPSGVLMVWKLPVSCGVLGIALSLAGWTPEGTVLVISAVATILIPSLIGLLRSMKDIKIVASRSEDILHKQNEVLARLDGSLDSRIKEVTEKIDAEYSLALNKLAEESRINRHDANNQINILQLKNTELQLKLEGKEKETK